MSRGRSSSPRLGKDEDMDIDNHSPGRKPDAKVVIVTNLTRNVVESHLKIIFGFYGQISKIDLPLFGKSGQNRGKAALEYSESSSARKAVSHMDGGQLDGAILKVELSDLPIRSNSRSPIRGSRPRRFRNGRDRIRSFSRSPSRSPRSRSPRSRSRSPLPPPSYRRRGGGGGDLYPRERDSFRGRGGFGRRGPPGRDRDYYRPGRSRSRSPIRRGVDRAPPIRRRSPSYTRGGYGGRRKSRSYSVRSSRSRSRSFSRSRSRSRSMSYSSASRNSRSRSRTRSVSRAKRSRSRSRSRDDIRDSRSRSPRT